MSDPMSLYDNWKKAVTERDALRADLSHTQTDRDVFKLEADVLSAQLAESRAEISRLKGELERINKVGLDRSLGQIVGSEHYEKAWLDCVEIAGRALFPPSSEKAPKGDSRG